MKKIIMILSAAALIIGSTAVLGGCGSSESSKTEQSTAAATNAASAAETKAAGNGAEGAFDPADAVFSYNGAKVELNQEMSAVLEALGEANSVSSQLSCHGQGEDKTYKYNGFIVNTYPKDGVDRVLEIVINDASIATSKGVKVGDSAADVIAAYGSGYKEIGMYYYYDAGEGKSLQFFIENDKVAEIDYYYEV